MSRLISNLINNIIILEKLIFPSVSFYLYEILYLDRKSQNKWEHASAYFGFVLFHISFLILGLSGPNHFCIMPNLGIIRDIRMTEARLNNAPIPTSAG